MEGRKDVAAALGTKIKSRFYKCGKIVKLRGIVLTRRTLSKQRWSM